MFIKKETIIEALAKHAEISQEKSEEIIEFLLQYISNELAKGDVADSGSYANSETEDAAAGKECSQNSTERADVPEKKKIVFTTVNTDSKTLEFLTDNETEWLRNRLEQTNAKLAKAKDARKKAEEKVKKVGDYLVSTVGELEKERIHNSRLEEDMQKLTEKLINTSQELAKATGTEKKEEESR